MRRNLFVIPVMLLMSAALWGQGEKKSATAPPSASKDALLSPSSLREQAPDVFKAKFTTTKGEFVIEVTRAWSPHGADRFYNLVKNQFYDGAAFFRVVPDFVAQFGIHPQPEISAAWGRATIPDDLLNESNARGKVTFATAGTNMRTTQVFINLADNSNLDSMGFTPFGEVIEGMEVVDKLYGGYGEGPPDGKGPDQDLIYTQGKAYLEKKFPELDTIKTAVIVP
jgi:peptidyl-prolyl cis-trans isomerase A (cyclophilin A)